MKIALYSTKTYDKLWFEKANETFNLDLTFFEARLNPRTAALAAGYEVICTFVNDELDEKVLRKLHEVGVKLVALRCSGFNQVDLQTAQELGVKIARVPAYSPNGVAEHAVALIMALNRRIHSAYNRIRERNFSLEGLIGFEVHEKTVGVVGTGRIGYEFARIMSGFGSRVIAYDPYENPKCKELNIPYVSLDELFKKSDIISLHLPLTEDSHHIIDSEAISKMKQGVMLINTSRGGLIDSRSVVEGLKSKKVGYLGLDVYEEESRLFFEDLSDEIIQDDIFARLTTFHNVIITGHQAFFTETALLNIARTTLENIKMFQNEEVPKERLVSCEHVSG